MDKVSRISQIIIQVFRLSLQQGSPNRTFLIEELKNTKSLSSIELEQVEEKVFGGILDIGAQWFMEHFPSLSLTEKCSCGCGGLRMKAREGQTSAIHASKSRA